jgi:hypothetical protein
VPLPPGDWQVLGVAVRDSAPDLGGRFTLGSHTLLLAQEQEGRLAGLVSIHASPRAQQAGYANWEVMACAPTAVSLGALVREGSDRYQNCADVRTWTPTTQRPATVPGQWLPYYDRAAREPGWAPAVFHTAWSRVAEASGSLDVIYHFSPETRGFARDERPWARNGWHPGNQSAEQRAHVARLKSWMTETHGRVRGGFQSGTATPASAF